MTRRIGEWQEITFNNDYYHNLSNAHLYRNVSRLGYAIHLGTLKGLFLSSELEYDYDSRPDVVDGVKLYTSPRWEF